jgi:hypothetical protein
MQTTLDAGKIEQIVRTLRSLSVTHPDLAETLRTEADYFERNAERMRYPLFRQQKLFVGAAVFQVAREKCSCDTRTTKSRSRCLPSRTRKMLLRHKNNEIIGIQALFEADGPRFW